MKTPPLYSDRSFFFQDELSWFLSPAIKDFSSFCLARVPSCFFEAPASSSGKYHPEYTKQKGGLVLHTRAAMGIAKKLLEGRIQEISSVPLLMIFMTRCCLRFFFTIPASMGQKSGPMIRLCIPCLSIL